MSIAIKSKNEDPGFRCKSSFHKENWLKVVISANPELLGMLLLPPRDVMLAISRNNYQMLTSEVFLDIFLFFEKITKYR